MKTCVLYGPKDLRIEERPVSEPQPGFVRLRMGGVGICGSDLHYYHIGRVGNAVVREPMILGRRGRCNRPRRIRPCAGPEGHHQPYR